jgi:hypothetical protein
MFKLILIVLFGTNTGAGASTSAVDFASQELCQAAATELQAHARGALVIDVTCVRADDH